MNFDYIKFYSILLFHIINVYNLISNTMLAMKSKKKKEFYRVSISWSIYLSILFCDYNKWVQNLVPSYIVWKYLITILVHFGECLSFF